MHIIIDIRSRHTEDAYIAQYAQNWAQKWRKYSPHDSITFLVFDSQEAPEGEQFLRVKPATWFSSPYKIIAKNSNEIFRCINFSRYSPYDPSVPTITHIFDMGLWLYDSETNANILRRKEREFEIKKLLKNSTHFIVPSFATGMELVELWDIHEAHIDVIPLIPIAKWKTDDKILETERIPDDFFLFDATFGIESNLEKFLKEFAKYVKKWWKNHLVLHGNSAKYLKNLTEIISENNLQKFIHITGSLPIVEREALYEKASAWIFVGAYNTSKSNIALAKSYNLPLVLSDIPAFAIYESATKIHPNHLENLSDLLLELEKNAEKLQKNEYEDRELEKAIFEKYRTILSENKKLAEKSLMKFFWFPQKIKKMSNYWIKKAKRVIPEKIWEKEKN